jgi:alpha 1,2-mannosyltransferase
MGFLGVIPKEHWSYPDWIDIGKADRLRNKMESDGIIYGGSLSYRHMCRLESSFGITNSLYN